MFYTSATGAVVTPVLHQSRQGNETSAYVMDVLLQQDRLQGFWKRGLNISGKKL